MDRPFSAQVTDAAWLEVVHGWIVAAVEGSGRVVTGPIEQRRVRPWSTQLVAPTDGGRVWFKANHPSMAFEPALHVLLARLVPGDVVAPLAVDAGRGWMLTADHGRVLGDVREPTVDDWCGVLRTTARVQRAVADAREDVLATGVLDCAPASVPDRFDAVLERLTALAVDHPSHVDAGTAAALRARRPELEDAVALLAGSPVPATLQHGDVHPWNTFDDLTVFDFGDAQWAHATEVLNVPFGWIRQHGPGPWEPFREAWGEAWSDVVGPARAARARGRQRLHPPGQPHRDVARRARGRHDAGAGRVGRRAPPPPAACARGMIGRRRASARARWAPSGGTACRVRPEEVVA